MPNSQSTLRRSYGYCYCTLCNGSLRTRRTIQAHAATLQRPLTASYRLCHCSQHPLGRMVHRHTLRRHVENDKAKGLDFKLTRDVQGLTDLVADGDDVNLQQIEDIRAATHLTQMLAAFDDAVESGRDGDNTDDGNISLGDETENIDEEERLDEMEEIQAQLESIDIAELTQDMDLLIDWIKFNEGITRAKRIELKALFKEHFPH
ncbi:hypothetical protein IFR05_017397, partial [Cadophora sp. M221]